MVDGHSCRCMIIEPDGRCCSAQLTGTLEKQASSRRKLSYGQEKGDILNTGTAEE